MLIHVSLPNRPTLQADVEFPPRPGDRLVVEHDYYRVDSVTWTWDVTSDPQVRVTAVDMYTSDRWIIWPWLIMFVLAAIGLTVLVARCAA